MSAGDGFPSLPRQDLLARLAAGDAARISIVTPNRRLARELALEFHDSQAAAGLVAWETADILPFSAFVQRLHEDAIYSDLMPRPPLLLSPEQEWELWQAAIRASEWGDLLLAVAATAEECRRAWALAHEWRIADGLGNFPGNEDARAFAAWAAAYARRSAKEGSTDEARLPDVMAPLLASGALRKPEFLVAYGYDVMAPQVRAFFDACRANGIQVEACGPRSRDGVACRIAFPSAREELEAAAQWARIRLEEGAARIGVVIPELGRRRKEVARVFARAMHPDRHLPGAARRTPIHNLSLGEPLASHALCHAALAVLELATGEVTFEHASKLIRSPFIAGAEAEFSSRALLDADLRKTAPARLGLAKLVALVEGAPVLRERLEALLQLARETAASERSPHEWGRRFSALLAAIGFPGERGLDSDEFQTHAKFNEVLAGFARLERIVPRLSAPRALSRLRHLCAETLFQPETPDAPVQVLGAFESAGLEFDALWVSGLTDEAWPLPARLNPFLSPVLQRKAGIPEGSAEGALALAKRMTDGWRAAAGEVVFSHPLMEGDRSLIVSPLIRDVAEQLPPLLAQPRHRDMIFALRRIETLQDGRAMVLPTRTPRGGTRILSDQAACPFRAFARHRLDAQALEEPVEGPDARTRGRLLHELMKALWADLRGSGGLGSDCGPAIARAAHTAVADAAIEEPFATLERRRLEKLAREWLDVERERPPFEVVATEEKRKLAVAGMELNGRIDRLDRLEAGGHALIDYKTGTPTPNSWKTPRPDDPQLPLYAVGATEEITAVAFAKLRTGDMKYMGFSDGADRIPGVKPAKDWDALLADWKAEVESLGADFANGDARVDPKKGLQTCRQCDLQPFCRVYERVNVLQEDEGDG
jgi:probable DNA repair protein